MEASLFCFQWVEMSYWNVDPKISIQKASTPPGWFHSAEKAIPARVWPTVPSPRQHVFQRWSAGGRLCLVSHTNSKTARRLYLGSVFWDFQLKKKSVSENHLCYYTWKYPRYGGRYSRMQIISQNMDVPFPAHHPQPKRKVSFEPAKSVWEKTP